MQEDIQIDTLIAKFFSGEASPEEAMQLEDWAESSPENRSYLNTSANFFTMNLALNTIENKQQVWENIKNVVDKPITQSGKRINWRWISVAASVMLILSIMFLRYTIVNQQNIETVYQAEEVAKKVMLKDNSAIIISPNSAITIDEDYGIASRAVKLQGSAQFSVKHDAARPFIVDVNSIHIKDLGTAFTVKTGPSGHFVFIGVTEGEVEVSDNFGYSKILKAGDAGTYSQIEKRLHLVHFERTEETPLPVIKGTKPGMQAPDTTQKKKAKTNLSAADTSRKVYSNSTYPSPYQPDKLYTREEIEKLMHKNIENAKKIIADMRQDGLVDKDAKDEQVSFKISNEGFIINGKVQSEKVYLKYKKKYFPHETTSRNWSWRNNFDEPDAKN